MKSEWIRSDARLAGVVMHILRVRPQHRINYFDYATSPSDVISIQAGLMTQKETDGA